MYLQNPRPWKKENARMATKNAKEDGLRSIRDAMPLPLNRPIRMMKGSPFIIQWPPTSAGPAFSGLAVQVEKRQSLTRIDNIIRYHGV